MEFNGVTVQEETTCKWRALGKCYSCDPELFRVGTKTPVVEDRWVVGYCKCLPGLILSFLLSILAHLAPTPLYSCIIRGSLFQNS